MAPSAQVPTDVELKRIVTRGVAEIIPFPEFVTRLREGKPLRLKMGFDPSAPDLHLGHVVGLRKLRQLQQLGHTVVVIVGDWTARIGDPSGRSETRPMLTAEQVMENAETYMRQFFSVVDRERTEVRYQSEWFEEFTLETVVRLTGQFTVNQFLHRDDFAKRYAGNSPIGVVELLYPLMQAYDSIAVQADVEFGGTDQRFNLLVGRDLQEKRGMRAQNVFLVPILPGTDGVRRMGKSLGNYIAVEDPPGDMYGKTMSLPDNIVPLYYDLLTDIDEDEMAEVRRAFEARSPRLMDLKKHLAHYLTTEFHGVDAASNAQAEFERVVQRREEPTAVEDISVTSNDSGVLSADGSGVTVDLASWLSDSGLVPSRNEARRLIQQAAVEIAGQRAEGVRQHIMFGSLVRVGKRKFVRVVKG